MTISRLHKSFDITSSPPIDTVFSRAQLLTHEWKEKRSSSRREFVLTTAALWQAAVLHAHEHSHSSEPAHVAAPYTFSFFNEEQKETLRLMMARIIPADERSPGAVGAKVDEYIDFILIHADPQVQQTWKLGLARYRAATAGKSAAEVESFLEKQALHEFGPTNEDETFFVILKAVLTEGFYTSEVGINQELGYKGMTFLMDFRGCTHSSHHVPEDWHPILRQLKEA